MKTSLPVGLIPVSEAAMIARVSRERLIRLVQTGNVKGEWRDGHWYVAKSDVDRLGFEAARKR